MNVPGWLETRRQVTYAYEQAAEAYVEATQDYAAFPGLRVEVEEFVSSVPAGSVLDLGSGSGRDGMAVAAQGRHVIFADVSLALLGRLAPRDVVCCDAVALPLRDARLAGVIASGVLLHLPRELCSAALTEIFRVLQPGGRASLSMKRGLGEGWRTESHFPNPRWYTYYQIDEFGTLCERAGLVVVDVLAGQREDWFTTTATRR
jgi:tRNA (uracil-5-)-methyltransferase TRM9